MKARFSFAAAAAVTVALAGCAGTPAVDTGPDAESIDGRLYPVSNAGQDLVYIDPAADFGHYRRILITPLDVDSVEILQPNRSGEQRRYRDWELTAEDRAWLQQAFQQAMVRELVEEGGYALSDGAADDVLQISAALTEIAPKAAKDDNQSRPAGRSTVYTEGGGSLSVAVAFADSRSGEVLALSKDRRDSGNRGQWGVNNRVTNQADVRRVFSAWARQLRTGLDRLREGGGSD